MCNILFTKHAICGCLIERTTLYCDDYKDAPTILCPKTKITHATVQYQCGCHAWVQLYKREERLAKERQMQTLWRRSQRERKKREEREREGVMEGGVSGSGSGSGSGTPMLEGGSQEGEEVQSTNDGDGEENGESEQGEGDAMETGSMERKD